MKMTMPLLRKVGLKSLKNIE
ncbi:phosphate starvation-inducible protein PhoH, partial [Shewanella sp. 11B5]